jgi:hypothetical protein
MGGNTMLFPIISGSFSKKNHAIKNSKVTECGIPYADFYEDFRRAKKSIFLRNVNDLNCYICRSKIEKNS